MEILVRAHSGLRYVVLALLIAAIYTAFTKRSQPNAPYSKVYLFAMIATHTQLLIGLVLYALDWGVKVRFDMMSDKFYRFYTVEHIVGMLVAIVLITIGHAQAKKLNHGKVFTFYLVALLLILISIPWPFRNLGGGWF
ncbi:cytochrome B [Runella sp. CRIBMP]|uniref:cytochrome B n=1 Tax=Runella sp. CRIBMP TaxID=2683261 RepID=UPI0014126C6F|nr:cytochrome B [Runella sp. CRIBMP]NBB19947.1 cytochrome B [Runella sp. CRIBMP]